MKLTFLGTGGGRFATITQRRMTGGFRIDDFDGKNFHVDPGPGALVRSLQFGLSPSTLDGVFISHAHTDHYTDGEVLIEAMTRGMTKERGIIIGSRSVFEGYKQWGPSVSKYHTEKSDKLILGSNKSRIIGNLKVKGTNTVHGDPTCVGFQMKSEDLTISYTSDTSYFEKLSQYHKGADILIASVIRPGTKSIKGHMCTGNFKDLVNEVEPKLAIMTHFGFKMLNEDPISEAKSITKDTGIKTLAAYDGMKIDINSQNVRSSVISSLKLNCNPEKYDNNIFKSSNRP
jgi:phosphoribosyl 1,2-cyclic phosphodiesterase